MIESIYKWLVTLKGYRETAGNEYLLLEHI